MSLGKRIQECREGLGISQAALAKRLGVSQSTVGNYEAGISFPREEVLLRLFGSFRVCFCRSRIGLCPVGGRSFRFCDRVRRLLRGLLCGLIVRRGRAHAAQPHDERQDQHQAEPSLFLHVLLLLWLEYYVYQKSTIFALYFQRFSPVLSKY